MLFRDPTKNSQILPFCWVFLLLKWKSDLKYSISVIYIINRLSRTVYMMFINYPVNVTTYNLRHLQKKNNISFFFFHNLYSICTFKNFTVPV